MLRKYRILVVDKIEISGYSVNNFLFSEKGDSLQIEYLENAKLYFTAEENHDSFHSFKCEYVNFEKNYPVTTSGHFVDVADMLKYVNVWLEEVSKWRDEFGISPFNSANPHLLSVAGIDFSQDESFTEQESELLQDDMEKTVEFIKAELNILPDRLQKIEEAIKDLGEKILQMGKSSWQSEAKSVLKDVVINAATDSISLARLWSIFSSILENPISLIA